MEGRDFIAGLMARATEAHQRGRLGEAEGLYLQALHKQPDLWEAQHLLGVLRGQQGRYQEALALVEASLKVKPDAVGALTNYGLILHHLHRHQDALAVFDKALAICPDHALALNNRGSVLSALGRDHDALVSYHRALAAKPDYAGAYNNLGNVLKDLGQFADAEAALLKALELDPKLAGVYVNLAECKKFTREDDPRLVAMQALEREEGLLTSDRIHLHFALGKAYADLKDHSRAFKHLLQGNTLKRSQLTYDEAATIIWIERIETVFTRDVVKARAGQGHSSPVPIFVVGMPRSGTTLVEQILASHRDVHGGGELKIMRDIIKTVHRPDGSAVPYPDFVGSVDGRVLKAIGTMYCVELQKLGPQVKHVTDKMPDNFFLAGLIHLTLPNARIIHVVRDPIDTCMSCFSTLFAAEHNYTYNLAELGRYHRRYQALMAHWHKVLPKGRIFDVHYEDIINDLEREVRRILTYCGLDWDPHCLEFHRTDRPVRTASARQVRQPIYKSAIGRWRVYEPYLGYLLGELSIENRAGHK